MRIASMKRVQGVSSGYGAVKMMNLGLILKRKKSGVKALKALLKIVLKA
ncbi:hypothetical protein [Helicobacter bilis]|nr:hypothetical protein [Helicobacter bilis]